MAFKSTQELYDEYTKAYFDYKYAPVTEIDYSKNFPEIVNDKIIFDSKSIVPVMIDCNRYIDFSRNCAIIYSEKYGYNYVSLEGKLLSEKWFTSADKFKSYCSVAKRQSFFANESSLFDSVSNQFFNFETNVIIVEYLGANLCLLDMRGKKVIYNIVTNQIIFTDKGLRSTFGSFDTSNYIKLIKTIIINGKSYTHYNFLSSDGKLLKSRWFNGEGVNEEPIQGLRKIDENKYLTETGKILKGTTYPFDKYKKLDGHNIEKVFDVYRCSYYDNEFYMRLYPIKTFGNSIPSRFFLCSDFITEIDDKSFYSSKGFRLFDKNSREYISLQDYGTFFRVSDNGIEFKDYPEKFRYCKALLLSNLGLLHLHEYDEEKFRTYRLANYDNTYIYDQNEFFALDYKVQCELVENAKNLSSNGNSFEDSIKKIKELEIECNGMKELRGALESLLGEQGKPKVKDFNSEQ